MKGYVKIPVYKDQACTQFYKNMKIPVIDKEFAQRLGQQKIQIVNEHTGQMIQAAGPGLYYDSSTFTTTGTCLSWGQIPGYNNISLEKMNEWNRIIQSRMASIFTAGSTYQDSVDDGYNLIRFFDESTTYYLRNGSSIVVSYTTETFDGVSNTHLVSAEFKNPNGFTVANLGIASGSASPVILNPRADQFYVSSAPKYGGYELAKEYCNTVKRNVGSSAYIVPFYLLDDDTLDNNQYDRFQSSTGQTYSQYSQSPLWYKSSGATGRGFLYKFLGATSTNNTVTKILEDAEYFDDTEDSENTYPGGGEDKNTYPEDGESGKGTFDNTNDEVDFPPMPLWDATSTGFISLWNPTITEITALYGFLWDSDISTTLKKLFLEPMDAIISLAFFPVDPTNFPEKRNVTIGHVDTEIEMYAVQKQFVDFDFGELVIDEYYGAAWDYSPYTQASIYLPYIGTQALDIDDVMNGTLHLKYRVDLLSGMCAAMLRVDRSRDGLQAVIYTWQGNCAMQVPITAGSARDFLNSIIQLGAMAGVSLAQPLAGAIDASMHKGEENYQSPIMGNNWINPTIATFSALNVIGQKVRVQRGGRVDANAGVMSPQDAYIILNRPVSAIPKGWNEYAGYPSLKVKTLSTQKGYTEIAYIKLNGLEATSDEIMELDGMLKGGVIL